VNQFGVKVDISYRNALASLAYTKTATGSNMLNPWSIQAYRRWIGRR
jgi:hypothetical protein